MERSKSGVCIAAKDPVSRLNFSHYVIAGCVALSDHIEMVVSGLYQSHAVRTTL